MAVQVDECRNDKLTKFGKQTLDDRYLLSGETPQGLFKRVAESYCPDNDHAQRMYDYLSKHWFMASTPILSNAGTTRGLPISCYMNKAEDTLENIAGIWNENVLIGAKGGGIGTCWSSVRSVGEEVQGRGGSSGVIPFMKVMDSLTLAISQGSLRRGSAACYLNVSHPEIEEFLEIRKPSGDFNRKSLNLHHGIVIPDAFMLAVQNGDQWDLKSPKTNKLLKTVDARELFQAILETRLSTGEPYLLFLNTVNKARPSHHVKLDLTVSQSNLCAEIVLPTGKDYNKKDRTAVCCLGSVNAELYSEWKGNEQFIEDCLRFLDGVLDNFAHLAGSESGLLNARYSVINERSVGLGLMGLHSYFQRNNIPFESATAKSFNMNVFREIRKAADKANTKLAKELGSCPDAIKAGEKRRFSYMLAVAPTASISIIAGGASPCMEPWNANIFTHKTLTGSVEVRNKYLTSLLKRMGKDTVAVWDSIIENQGSVARLDFLTQHEKAVFKTAFEIDQRWVVEFAGDRAKYIDQSQSVNLFLNGDIAKWELLMLHINAWKLGVKSLYYLRSRSLQRAGFAGGVESDNTLGNNHIIVNGQDKLDFDECLACQ